jgi:ribosomal protein S18 acetylase RimI-like enzyme
MARPVHRVSGAIAPGEEEAASNALRTLTSTPGFAYTRVPTVDVSLAQIFEDAGFRIVDTSVTLEAETISGNPKPGSTVRMAHNADATAVEAIARTAFRFSRFHLDPRVPAILANEIKAQWAGNFFRGKRGDYMVVAEHASQVDGFLQLLAGHDGTLTIDLIAVAERHRGRGLASDMIRFAARNCGTPSRIRVGTQAANITSLRLYEHLGFRLTAASYVLHCHGPVK